MKTKTLLLLLAGFLLSITNLVAQDTNFFIFLCFGQSNMEGFPGIEQQDKVPVDDRFQALAAVDFPSLGRTKGNWYPAVPPLCRPSSGLGPADYFGRTLVSNLPPNIKVGIVNVSVAGCKIELFENDTFQTYASTAPEWMTNIINAYDGNPYQHLVDMAKLAQKEGVIKGILLHQGESNTNDKEWPSKVKGIYDRLLQDLNLKPDSVPLLAGEVVNADQNGACASMNSIIAGLPQTITNSYVISSSGCTSRPDHLHFNPAGYRELGRRYGEKMLSLLGYQLAGAGAAGTAPEVFPTAQPKSFISYFLPTPPHGELSSDAWGATNVLPRDSKNGLEDTTIKQYCYWDGQILKAPDGKYHLFASRWAESRGHNGWFGSVAVHAVSDSLMGPYIDTGLCWPNEAGGRGHNVGALTMPDGRYAVYVSETRPCEVYVSKSLNGPWEHLGTITVEDNPRWHGSNVSLMVRPDGTFEFTQRDGSIFTSEKGILGPYKRQSASVYPTGIPNLEDPCIWYSGGLYHIVVNSWSTRKAYHLTSHDGVHDWTNRGVAYDPREAIVRYPDGTVNHWNKAERPSVYIQNGHVAAMTLAVIDVEKEQDKGGDGHGSKVIVIPFDGTALDRDLQPTADSSKQ
ncbi:MAG: sialate O-acetylesterase [Limisphaerales bacterium]